MKFHYNSDGERESLIIISPKSTQVIPQTHINFVDIRDALINGDDISDEEIMDLVDAATNVTDKLTKLSDRVSVEGSTIFFDNEEVENSLTNHIVRMIKSNDDNYVGWVNFMENLANNPSKKSRKHLFEWLKDRDFTITDEGHFIAYKGVSSEGKSISSGSAIVDGVRVSGHIPNEIGSVIEMPRVDVDNDRETFCSTGLHAGTERYASNFGNRVLIVAINPRDVVAVPSDSNNEKLRVCRYTVVDVSPGLITTPTYHAPVSWPWTEDDEDDSFEDECGCECDGCESDCDGYCC